MRSASQPTQINASTEFKSAHAWRITSCFSRELANKYITGYRACVYVCEGKFGNAKADTTTRQSIILETGIGREKGERYKEIGKGG